MKQVFGILIMSVFLFMDAFSETPMPDPSAVYCKFLGYEYVVRKDLKGNEHAVCIFPNGSECDTWSFYRGTCGQEYSYCAKKGCETKSITEDKNGYKVLYCACVCRDSIGNKKEIPLKKFMEQNGDTLIKSNHSRFGKGK